MKRKKISKLISFLLTMSCVTLIGAFSACKDNYTDSSSSSKLPPTSEDSTSKEDVGDRAYYIDVQHEEIRLLIGDSYTVVPSLLLGGSLIADTTFTFESLNTAVATVDSNGKVVSVGAGQTKIKISTVEYENVETFVDIVSNADLTLDISNTKVNLAKSEKFGFSNKIELDYQVKWQQAPVDNAEIELAVSNQNVIAEVKNSKIYLTAQEVGETVITAKYVKGTDTVETTVLVTVMKPFFEVDEPYLFSTGGAKSIDLSVIDDLKQYDCKADELVKVYYKQGEFPIETKSGSVATLSNVEVLGESGAEIPVTLEFEDYEISMSLKGYTHVIRTAQDLTICGIS